MIKRIHTSQVIPLKNFLKSNHHRGKPNHLSSLKYKICPDLNIKHSSVFSSTTTLEHLLLKSNLKHQLWSTINCPQIQSSTAHQPIALSPYSTWWELHQEALVLVLFLLIFKITNRFSVVVHLVEFWHPDSSVPNRWKYDFFFGLGPYNMVGWFTSPAGDFAWHLHSSTITKYSSGTLSDVS
jgi:hypothetical protein